MDSIASWNRRELSRVLYTSERFDEAREEMNRVLVMSPNMTTAYLGLSWIAPFFRTLHADPQWPAFLKKIGLGE